MTRFPSKETRISGSYQKSGRAVKLFLGLPKEPKMPLGLKAGLQNWEIISMPPSLWQLDTVVCHRKSPERPAPSH